MVWRARTVVKGNRLNFVPTHHWLPREDGFGVNQFCYMHSEGGGDKGTCKSWTPGKIDEFKKSMTLCMAEAMRQGFIPYVRPHLDDGLNRCVSAAGLGRPDAAAAAAAAAPEQQQQHCPPTASLPANLACLGPVPAAARLTLNFAAASGATA
jgi:hypothetical protein